MAGSGPDSSQMQRLTVHREKLKDELEHLALQGRRWTELASLRLSHARELDELKQRLEQWALEAKGFEVALQVRPTWLKKAEIRQRMQDLHARTDLSDSAADRLAEIDLEIGQQTEKLQAIKARRVELREQAQRLPLRKGIMEQAAKIGAAAEQAPWIASIQKSQQRLETQIEQARQQLAEEAARLGMSEEDQRALAEDRRLNSLPDLSRQALNQLAQPASEVRMWTSRLKQAKDQCDQEHRAAEKLQQDLTAAAGTQPDGYPLGAQ